MRNLINNIYVFTDIYTGYFENKYIELRMEAEFHETADDCNYYC